MYMEEFSQRLKKAMQDNKITITKLSNMSKISKPLLSNYLKGNYKAKQDNIYILSEVLNVSPAWLMGYDPSDDNKADNKNNISQKEILFNKTKDILSDSDWATIEFIMNKTIEEYEKNKNGG